MYMKNIVIQSNVSNLSTVEQFLDTICDSMNISNYYATITMAVLQAVENAIVHGNNSDENKFVSIDCFKCRGGIAFTIEDEGEGFDFSTYSDLPMLEGKGDGIFLMKTLSDKCEFTEGGKKVRLEFMIQGIEALHSLERAATLQHFFKPKKVKV